MSSKKIFLIAILFLIFAITLPAQAAMPEPEVAPILSENDLSEPIVWLTGKPDETPGNNGRFFINGEETGGNNEPHCNCQFSLGADRFDDGQTINWFITPHSPTGEPSDLIIASGTLIMDTNGEGTVNIDVTDNANFHSVAPHPKQGTHVDVYFATGEGGGKKSHKAWINCNPEPEPEWPHNWTANCNVVEIAMKNDSQNAVWAEGWLKDEDENILGSNAHYVNADDWFSIGWSDTSGFKGNVYGKITFRDAEGGNILVEYENEDYLDCDGVCDINTITGWFEYEGDHMSGYPVVGYVSNSETDPDCPNVVWVHIFGSNQYPQTPGWLENQTWVATVPIEVPANTLDMKITINFPRDDYCWYQVDLTRTPEVLNPPYYHGWKMIDYAFVQGSLPCTTTGTASCTGGTITNAQPFDINVDYFVDGESIWEGNIPSNSTAKVEYEYTDNPIHTAFFTWEGDGQSETVNLGNFGPCGQPTEKEGACWFANGQLTWNFDNLLYSGEVGGLGTEWGVGDEGVHPDAGEFYDSGQGSSGTFEFVLKWENRTDVKKYYQAWIKGYDGVWYTSNDCIFKPILECPDCDSYLAEGFGNSKVTPANASVSSAEDGFQLDFSSSECTVYPCNTLVMPVTALFRGFHPFKIPYRETILTPEKLDTLAGEVWVKELAYEWLDDGKDFMLEDEDGNRLRDTYGQYSVEKYISCSLTVGKYDVLKEDCIAVWHQPQTVYDWQVFIIKELKLLDNKQSSWDQVNRWAKDLQKLGELSLDSLDNAEYGDPETGMVKPVDLSGLGCADSNANLDGTLTIASGELPIEF